jgi:hypothetical protein
VTGTTVLGTIGYSSSKTHSDDKGTGIVVKDLDPTQAAAIWATPITKVQLLTITYKDISGNVVAVRYQYAAVGNGGWTYRTSPP